MMMAPVWCWTPLPAWLGSSATWLVALTLNAIVAVIAVLSSRSRRPLLSPRGGARLTRRASSAVLQSLPSFSIFSFPSGCLPFLQPDTAVAAAAAADQETEEPATSPTRPSPRALALTPPPAPAPSAADEEEEDLNGMSMDEAYALVTASRQRPVREWEEAARRLDVDAKAEEFIRKFKEDLRLQRLNSIFNYTQMLRLRQRELGAGRRVSKQSR